MNVSNKGLGTQILRSLNTLAWLYNYSNKDTTQLYVKVT